MNKVYAVITFLILSVGTAALIVHVVEANRTVKEAFKPTNSKEFVIGYNIVTEEVRKLHIVAEVYFGKEIAKPKIVILDDIGINTLGQTVYNTQSKTGEIRLLRRLIENAPKDYLGTVKHEYAHYIDSHVVGTEASHGKSWRMICRLFGLEVPEGVISTANDAVIKAYHNK